MTIWINRKRIANYFERVNMAKQKNSQTSNVGKENSNYSYKREGNNRESLSPYASNKNISRTARKQTTADPQVFQTKQRQGYKIKYEDAVKELHKKLMSLNI